MRHLRALTAVLALVVLGGCVVAAAAAVARPYHCYRPIEMMPSLSSSGDIRHSENCLFDYVRITDAAVSVDCYNHGVFAVGGGATNATGLEERFGSVAGAAPAADGKDGCYATMRFRAHKAPGAFKRGHIRDDNGRFSVKLHAEGAGMVHYKGVNGRGYSACCDLLTQGQSAECVWEGEAVNGTQRQVVQRCDLEETAEDAARQERDPLGLLERAPAPTSVVGAVTKPLHRQHAGQWTMEVMFFRDTAAVGKLTASVDVTHEMLLALVPAKEEAAATEGHHRNSHHHAHHHRRHHRHEHPAGHHVDEHQEAPAPEAEDGPLLLAA